MNKSIVTVETISNLEANWYEEDSYGFLLENQFGDWHIYDSDQIGLDAAKALANNFMAFHGTVYFPQKNELVETFWTPIPLGVFRYKMLSTGLPYLIDSYDKAVYFFTAYVEDAELKEKLEIILRQLCHPDPKRRGHPKNIQSIGSSMSVERFISQFDYLAKVAEINLSKKVYNGTV